MIQDEEPEEPGQPNHRPSPRPPELWRYHRKTCKRYDTPGEAHSLTFSCFRQRKFLSKDRTRAWLVEAIDAARARHAFDIWAYVIMPEHVHLLICPTRERYSISRILADIKQPVTRRAIAYLAEHAPDFLRCLRDRQADGKIVHRFWKRGGGYDRNLTDPRKIMDTIDYVHANPVRRALVDNPEDWYWSSARAHAGTSDRPLSVDLDSLPPRDGGRPPRRWT